MKADCANCKTHACYTKGTNCTGIDRETILEAYTEDERRMMKAAAYVEGTFYSNFQARILVEKGTQLFISCGLCVGHDAIFNASCPGPVTTLVVKDRLLAHNPLGAIYSRYWKRKLGIMEEEDV